MYFYKQFYDLPARRNLLFGKNIRTNKGKRDPLSPVRHFMKRKKKDRPLKMEEKKIQNVKSEMSSSYSNLYQVIILKLFPIYTL